MRNAAEMSTLPREQLDMLTLRVRLQKSSGDRININLPMSVVRLCVAYGITVPPLGKSGKILRQIDLKQILSQVEKGKTGHLLQLQSAGGDVLELVVE